MNWINKLIEALPPFIRNIFRIEIGIILQLAILEYFKPQSLDIIIVQELPITGLRFIILLLGGLGIMTSAYIFTQFLEVIILSILWGLKRANILKGEEE